MKISKPKPIASASDGTLKFEYGKYQGVAVSEVPSDYLLFLRYHNKEYTKEFDRVLRERGELPFPTVPRIEEVIIAGQQSLAKKYHPDCGGTNQQMKEVEAAADALLEIMKLAK